MRLHLIILFLLFPNKNFAQVIIIKDLGDLPAGKITSLEDYFSHLCQDEPQTTRESCIIKHESFWLINYFFAEIVE